VITIHQRYRQTDRRTDRQTTCDRNTALCTKVHRAVKTPSATGLHPLTTDWSGRWISLFSRYRLAFSSSPLCSDCSLLSQLGNFKLYLLNCYIYSIIQVIHIRWTNTALNINQYYSWSGACDRSRNWRWLNIGWNGAELWVGLRKKKPSCR